MPIFREHTRISIGALAAFFFIYLVLRATGVDVTAPLIAAVTPGSSEETFVVLADNGQAAGEAAFGPREARTELGTRLAFAAARVAAADAADGGIRERGGGAGGSDSGSGSGGGGSDDSGGGGSGGSGGGGSGGSGGGGGGTGAVDGVVGTVSGATGSVTATVDEATRGATRPVTGVVDGAIGAVDDAASDVTLPAP